MTAKSNYLTIGCSILLGITAAYAAGEAPAGGVAIDFRKNISLTPQETLNQSREYYTTMQETQRRIDQLAAKARRDRDVVKLNCVNDKGAQVRGHIAVTEEAMKSLNDTIARRDDAGRQHVFTRITILYQKVVILSTEAEQCIGEDVSYVGETRVDVEIDPSVPQEDPTQAPLPMPVVTRPPEATPFV
jgi:hypothetical protein